MQHYLPVICFVLLLFGIVHSIADHDGTTTNTVEEKSCSSSPALSGDGENAADFTIIDTVIPDDNGGCGADIPDVSFSSSSAGLDQKQQQQQQQQQQHEEKRMKKLDLHKLIYDIGQGPETTWVYKETPEKSTTSRRGQTVPRLLQSMEKEEPVADADVATQPSQSSSAAVRLCKFYNLSHRTLHLILKHDGDDLHFELVKKYSPMMASAVACQIGQEFFFLDLTNPQEPVAEYKVQQDDHDVVVDPGAFLFVHDDYVRDSNGLASLPVPLHEQYVLFQKTLAFDKVYRQATAGRAFLSNIGRARPVYPLWQADHVGQTHRVATMDDQEQESFLTLEAVSTSPRIFKIPNFLSLSEVQHILTLAQEKGMKPSETSGQAQRRRAQSSASSDAITRTSQTTWLSQHSPMLKVIYQRAADILQIPPHILQSDVMEDLQVVHYTENAEYKAHYDFGFPPITHPQQPTRFATLLIYLNDDMDGGETAFPRAVHHRQGQHQSTPKNNQTVTNAWVFKQKPETGTAILFYNMLPDGNMDERSLHAALPVLRGEKYVCNLWLWDPVADLVGLN